MPIFRLFLIAWMCLSVGYQAVMGDEPRERQQRAIAAIEKLGGKVHRLVKDGAFSDALYVNLSGTSVTNQDLAILVNLKGLEQVYLDNTYISDAGLEHLESIPTLREITARKSNITKEGIQRFRLATDNRVFVFATPRRRPFSFKKLALALFFCGPFLAGGIWLIHAAWTRVDKPEGARASAFKAGVMLTLLFGIILIFSVVQAFGFDFYLSNVFDWF